MRDVDAHVSQAVALVTELPVHLAPLVDAQGLVVARDVIAQYASPPFANSAMDGFAVRSEDAASASELAPVSLVVVGESAAGGALPPTIGRGQAVRIMTGAPIPRGADAVVPIELVQAELESVTLAAPAPGGAHIRLAGEDVAEGDTVLSAGTRLTATRLAAAAATGHGEVWVRRAPVVAVIATGDELVDPGQPLGAGQIPDSNTVILAGLIREAGGVPMVLARSSDRPEALLEALSAVTADLIVTTGGVSVGDYDVVKAALAPLGVDFASVAMQPGKPQGLGLFRGVPIACLPGNPVSVLVSFAVVVRPMMRSLVGEDAPVPRTAITASEWASPAGRRQHIPVRFLPDGRVEPATARGSQSHLVARLAHAQALAVVAEQITHVNAGDTVGLMEFTA